MPAPTRTRSSNSSSIRSDLSSGNTHPAAGNESASSSKLTLNEKDAPVNGFAFASSKRNAEYHELFPSIPEGDRLIEAYICALQREILLQGSMYISKNYVCFHANIFGWVTDLSIPIHEITGLEKKMTAFVIPNAIQITTRQAKYTFASFLVRDATYDLITNIWRLTRPDDVKQADSFDVSTTSTSLATSASEESLKECPATRANNVTYCACSKNGGHLSELALETVLPGTPDKIYNLMFESSFITEFIQAHQKLADVQISDWTLIDQVSKSLQRDMSSVMPLDNSFGLRETKCETHEEVVHRDLEDYAVVVASTRTPDVPSGDVFVIKTRTCLMWASSVTTRVIVTTQVEWSGWSFISVLIEQSVIKGQKVYYSELAKAIRMYIQEHQAEFVPEGLDPAAVAPVETITPLAEAIGDAEVPSSAQEVPKARTRDRKGRGVQSAYDTLGSVYQVAERSTKGAAGLVKEAREQSSTTILWFVIVLLVFSNAWTLTLVGDREAGRREMKRAEERERWLQGVIVNLLDERTAERTKADWGATVPIRDVHL